MNVRSHFTKRLVSKICEGIAAPAVFLGGLMLMAWSPLIIMLFGIALLSPLGIFLAVLTGLGAGMALSQVWNPSNQLRSVINYTVQQVIEGIITGGIIVAISFGPIGFIALALLWVISQVIDNYVLSKLTIDRRKMEMFEYV